MNRKAAIILGVLLLAAILGVLFTSPRTPQYNGKTLGEWLVMLDPSVDRRADHEQAREAIRHMGATALPYLRHILRSRPNSVREWLRDHAVRWHLMRPDKLSIRDQEYRAARAAYQLAEDAGVNIASLVPDLRFHFTNSNYAETEMARALARADPEGVSCLTNLLATGERRVRDQAGWALALDRKVRSQPGVQEALIQRAAADPDAFVRANLGLYLSSFREAGATNRLVPLGLQFLRSDDGYSRWAGALLLQNYRSVPEAKAALQAAASDPDQRVRSVVERALKEPATKPDRR